MALRVAVAEIVERVRRQLSGRPGPFARLRRWFEESFPAPGLKIEPIGRAAQFGRSKPPGRQVAEALRHRAPGGDGTAGHGARGRRDLQRPRRRGRRAPALSATWSRRTGLSSERPAVRLRLRFDAATWYHADRGTLSVGDVRALVRRLCCRYPGALGMVAPPGPTPSSSSAASPLPGPAASRRRGGGGGGTGGGAAPRPAARRCRADDLPGALRQVLQYAAKKLLRLAPERSSRAASELRIRDKGVSTQILFYLGDTLPETDRAAADRDGVAAGRRPSVRHREDRAAGRDEPRVLPRGLRERAPGRRRGTVRETVTDNDSRPAAYGLWHRAESGESHRRRGPVAGRLSPRAPARGLRASRLPPLAVRRDVDVGDVELVLELDRAVRTEAIVALARRFATHSDDSAAQWYARWVRDRLGRRDLTFAWAEWQAANRRLEELLELSPGRAAGGRGPGPGLSDRRLPVAAGRLRRRAAVPRRRRVGALRRPGGGRRRGAGGVGGLARGGRGDAGAGGGAQGECGAAAERARGGVGEVRGRLRDPCGRSEVDPWIEGRIHSLYASLLNQKGEEQEAFRTLDVAARSFQGRRRPARAGPVRDGQMLRVVRQGPRSFAGC